MAATETSTRAAGALDGLYRRHVGEVYRYAYAVLGNHADAEDVTQTTFVNALRALERGEKPREPSHWLLAIAHNIVRQRWRQAAARPSEVELHDVAGDDGSDEPAPLDELVRALQRIPPTQREAIVMRELEGRSYREISEIMGISTSALETLLFRARRSLAEEMENLVTCDRAELSLSRQADGRLSRKERRRLDDHLKECPSCAAVAKSQHRTRRTFKGLAMLPLPLGLALFRDLPGASAASLPTIGLASGGAVAGTAVTTGSAVGGAVGGGIVGGAALKVAAAVAAVGVASGVGYKGVEAAHERLAPAKAIPAPTAKAGSGGKSSRSEVERTNGSRASVSAASHAKQATTRVKGGAATKPRKGPLAVGRTKARNDKPKAFKRRSTIDRKPGPAISRSRVAGDTGKSPAKAASPKKPVRAGGVTSAKDRAGDTEGSTGAQRTGADGQKSTVVANGEKGGAWKPAAVDAPADPVAPVADAGEQGASTGKGSAAAKKR